MDVILLERIEKLGQMGDIVTVKPGFARNFLLPQGKALRATEHNKSHFEAQRAQLEADNLKRKSEAEAVAGKMTDMKVVLIRQAGDAGQLYGSVTGRDIADAITEAGVTVKRGQVVLDKPIKTIGMHEVRIELHGEVIVSVVANVARSRDEAETQEKTGAAVLSLAQQEQMEIEAEAEAAADAAIAVAEQAGVVFEEGAAEEAVAEAEAEADAAAEQEEEAPAADAEEAAADEGEATDDDKTS
ncbi:MAG: 50S ribosomal protein L9 [Rhodospirillales bacterium]|nr:50S ribosomal protein L9 [Rhodospirillales bacterium]MBO6786235.1 50S ribosomal protein L9 [Rhodospirillales bacterium]